MSQYRLKGFPEYVLPCKYILQGHSRSAERSGFIIKELGIMLDAGIVTFKQPHLILITHGHLDHVFALPMIIINNPDHIDVFVPQKIKSLTINFVKATMGLSRNKENYKGPNCYSIMGLNPDEERVININKRNFVITAIKCTHTIPTHGYIIHELRNKLLPELVGCDKSEIIKRKKQGKDITYKQKYPILAYICDTHTFNVDDRFKECTTIMIECTFLYEHDVQEAKTKKHMHWKYIEPMVNKFPNKTFILFHFSLKYPDNYINEFFKNAKNNGDILHNNVVLWLDSGVVDV